MHTAYFSILCPRKRLPPQRGPFKGVLRYHLGLRVPDRSQQLCGIRVGGQTRSWAEGASLLFDNTFVHSAWNESGETRVVLIVDVERPLHPPMAQINRALIRVIGALPAVRRANARVQRGRS